jgi:hypothetical protein
LAELEDLAAKIVRRELRAVANYIQNNLSGNYIQTLFKNYTKCGEMDSAVPLVIVDPADENGDPQRNLEFND